MALYSASESPAIIVREVDLTNGVPNVPTWTGAIVGDFRWGPVETPVLVNNEAKLASVFGNPDPERSVDFHSASYYLRYSDDLYVIREITETEIPGSAADSDGIEFAANAFDKNVILAEWPVIKNEDNFENQRGAFDSAGHTFVAKWPGELGNSLTISMCGAEEAHFASWAYKTYFNDVPGTSDYADKKGATNDEVHVVVIDANGEFTGTKNSVLETFSFLSLASDAKKPDGGGNYVLETINRVSKYIWMASIPTAMGTNSSTPATNGKVFTAGATVVYTTSLTNGKNSDVLTAAQYTTGFDLLNDPNTYLVDFLIAPGLSNATDHKTVINYMVTIAENTRKDCVVVASPNRDAVVDDPTAARENIITDLSTGVTRSSYLVMDSNYLKVYDKFNDQYIYIPAASSTAGLMAASDNNFAPWYSPAGTRRGRYFGVTQLAYNPNKQDRDELYKAGFNPVANIPGQGILLYGDKTHLARPSAFDRINVRRLFLVLERAIARAAQNIMFEFNDEFTRAEFVNIVEPVLRNVQGRRGITDFKLVCDETNNTPEIIDTNQFIASLFIKPARSINYITLNFVAVRTGVSFEEVVGDNRI